MIAQSPNEISIMRVLKVLAVALAAVAASAVGGYFWATRDIAPTHPSLAAADLPELISVREFFADTSAAWGHVLSADGRYLAHSGSRNFAHAVILSDAESGREIAAEPNVDWYAWTAEPHRLAVIREGRLYLVDATDPEAEWDDITPRGFADWWLVDLPAPGQTDVAVTSTDRNPAFADLYRVDPDGHGKRLVAENDGTILTWVLDADQQPVVRLERPSPRITRVAVAEGDGWRPVVDMPVDDVFAPVEVTPDGRTLIAVSGRGRDTTALVAVELETGKEEVLAAFDGHDVGDLVNLARGDGAVDLAVSDIDHRRRVAMTPAGETLDRLLTEVAPRVQIDGLSWAPGSLRVSATLTPDARGYLYYHFDLDAGTAERLAEFPFRTRNLERLASVEDVTFTARDGMEIHAVLTRPAGVDGPGPLVVNVHGGPAQRDAWGYDHLNQFLANRGYAVLSVNFRGSTGFGRAYQAAGFGAFGAAMQHDVEDAAEWAIDAGIADPDAVAITGGSYGGYAAAMGALDRPDLFRAAVIEHAMLDVAYQSQFPPHAWALDAALWTRYFGDPDDPADLKRMRERSPIARAADLSVPVLLIAGKRDSVVGFEQTERFAEAAEAAGAEVETLIFEDEGHGLSLWQSEVRRARAVEDFLARTLGGRSGGWDPAELAAEHL
ncbi:S9 family peptidase [Rhodobacteraceae bacterium CCMM004]|nr:S9 family peptidase [Rhodobacteraceae bacterium CCMM004]